MTKPATPMDVTFWYDPNATLPEALRSFAVERMADVLAEGRPQATPGSSILDFRIGYQRLLVYVRVTEDMSHREGTGLLPGIVRETAQRLDGDAYVVRINVSSKAGAIAFSYWGLEEVRQAFRSSPCDWTKHFMGRERFWRTCRRARRSLSVLTVDPMICFLGSRRRGNQALDRQAGPRSVIEADEKLRLGLRIDGKYFEKGKTVCPCALAASIHGSDEQFIFTCGCGFPGCAGIEDGFAVLHNADRVVWLVNSLPEAPVFVFDRRQYCDEVRMKLGWAVKLSQENGVWIPYGVNSQSVLYHLMNAWRGGKQSEVIWQREAG